MQQTDCNGILLCSDPGLHIPAWFGDHCDQVSAQHLESVRPCGLDPLPMSCGTGAGGPSRPPPAGPSAG